MKFWVGVTDNSWFDFLSKRQPDEVNFWQPGGTTVFKSLNPGELFLFKRRFPLNFIAGGGFFVRHSFLPVSLAWETFEQKNGAETFDNFYSIAPNRQKLYLATFELTSGQYGQLFNLLFYARDEKSLGKKIHKYLKNCYDKGNNTSTDKNVYYYFDGEVSVENHGWEEITDMQRIIDKLLC